MGIVWDVWWLVRHQLIAHFYSLLCRLCISFPIIAVLDSMFGVCVSALWRSICESELERKSEMVFVCVCVCARFQIEKWVDVVIIGLNKLCYVAAAAAHSSIYLFFCLSLLFRLCVLCFIFLFVIVCCCSAIWISLFISAIFRFDSLASHLVCHNATVAAATSLPPTPSPWTLTLFFSPSFICFQFCFHFTELPAQKILLDRPPKWLLLVAW